MAAAAPALARQPKPTDPLSVRLSDSVGKGRRNLVADVQAWQRRFNALIAEHYLNGNEWNSLDETGMLDERSATSISQLEEKYFSPPRKGFVEPNDRLDKFTRELACGPLDVKDSMYGLAHQMLPAGGDVYVSVRGGREQFDHGNIRKFLPEVYAALEEHSLDDTNMLLVALATIAAENATFKPLDEPLDGSNTTRDPKTGKWHDPAFDRYNNRNGNNNEHDGYNYRGRGFIQLTFRGNYQSIGRQLGIDLEKNPDEASTPAIAAKILAQYLKNWEKDIRAALKTNDLARIRKKINGGYNGLDQFRIAITVGRQYLHISQGLPKARIVAKKHALARR